MHGLRWASARLTALAILATAVVLAACSTPTERFERRASQLGFTALLLQGDGFAHRSFAAAEPGGASLHVYIEHDGTPWERLDRVAADPTPRNPFALELMGRDTGARLLLGRPCYFETQADPPCNALAWTHERYSPQVVASMAAALRRYLAVHPFQHVVLIGYSGGGTLAWLMAARIPETRAVVTLAANLDVEAWARRHGYTALAGSLNPATAAALPTNVTERHYVGGRDAKVPATIVQEFARHHPRATVVEIAHFDHVCCWIERWPQLLGNVRY